MENKDRLDFYNIYYGGEWSSKLRLSDHMVKGWEFGPIHLSMKNQFPLLVFPYLSNSRPLNWTMHTFGSFVVKASSTILFN